VGLAVEDQGPIGLALGEAFRSVGAFKVATGARAELMSRLKQGDMRVLIVVPDGVSASVTSGRGADVEAYYDPSNQTTAQVVLAIVERVIDAFDRGVSGRPALLSVRPLSVISESLRYIDLLLPGILGMSLMQLGLFATAPELVQLREQQVLRRMGATPLPRTTLLASQVMHRLTIGLTQTFIIVIVGVLAFKVYILGNVALLVGVVLLGAMAFVAMGYLISGLAKTQESVIGISQFINFPMMFLSGVFFPVEIMPAWIKPVMNAMPLTYLVDALRQIMVGATPLHSLGLDLGVLAVWLVVCSVLAVRFFRWE
jgi:ABC-2 type transport system permease protein